MAGILESIGGASLIGLHILMGPVLKGWRRRWGASKEELAEQLPDGANFPHDSWSHTRAIDIHAAPHAIWPWIAQMGQGRAGFYSYEGLENIVGCKIRNVNRVIPELQHLEEGDPIFLHPHAPPLHVTAVVPDRLLYLTSEQADTGVDGPQMGWLFEIKPKEHGSRLIVRGHHAYGKHLADRIIAGPVILDPVSFVMERKMLLNIKKLAESYQSDLRQFGVTTHT